ncbi:MAG TPA: hypothetical protein VHM88_18705 [Candidatus Acidoferrales bacterium]|nr:hypothetical protein [Candidatus Acidoferrales bacterium]
MERPKANSDILGVERDVLRAMCQSVPGCDVLHDGLEILADYRFMDSTHQLVFDTLRELRAGNPRLIRERLPARLNNKGFPDLDLETFFAPQRLTADEAVAEMHAIKTASLRTP